MKWKEREVASYNIGKPEILRKLLDAGWRCEPDGNALYAAFRLKEWRSLEMLVSIMECASTALALTMVCVVIDGIRHSNYPSIRREAYVRQL